MEKEKRTRCISLIGMPGSGKSTLVKPLAHALDYTWVDTDLLIEAWFGAPLEDIKNYLGNKDFLRAEEYIVSHLSVEKCIIATGGSVVYSSLAMERLRTLGIVVYLRCSLEEIKNRIEKNPQRGLIIQKGQTLEDLYRERTPLYEKFADIIISTDNLSPEECVHNILQWLGKQHERKRN